MRAQDLLCIQCGTASTLIFSTQFLICKRKLVDLCLNGHWLWLIANWRKKGYFVSQKKKKEKEKHNIQCAQLPIFLGAGGRKSLLPIGVQNFDDGCVQHGDIFSCLTSDLYPKSRSHSTTWQIFIHVLHLLSFVWSFISYSAIPQLLRGQNCVNDIKKHSILASKCMQSCPWFSSDPMGKMT